MLTGASRLEGITLTASYSVTVGRQPEPHHLSQTEGELETFQKRASSLHPQGPSVDILNHRQVKRDGGVPWQQLAQKHPVDS